MKTTVQSRLRRPAKKFAKVALTVALVALGLQLLTRTVQSPGWKPETAAIRAIQQIHTAEVQYYSQNGNFTGSLAELGAPPGRGYTLSLSGTLNGYTVLAVAGAKTFYSDQTMVIRESDARQPATAHSKPIR